MAQCSVCGETRFPGQDTCPACGHLYDGGGGATSGGDDEDDEDDDGHPSSGGWYQRQSARSPRGWS
jgi:hypothetical protein